MKKNKYIGMMMLAATMLTATSCSDFDDYNKAVVDTVPAANQTLWQNIQQNDQLSDFANLLKTVGYDSILNATQCYTVWAPLNNTYDASTFQSLGKSALLRQFVNNHIANYSHLASGNINERILMLNEKSYDFTGSGKFTFDGVSLNTANVPSNNGVMHTLNGVATFYPNLYEFVTDTVQNKAYSIDSLSRFFRRYEQSYLDTENSVPGPIVNGYQTYVDSVIITENTLWSSLNFKMNNEDSTYTMLVPTNKAWISTYNKIKNSFNYIGTTLAQAFIPDARKGAEGATIASSPISITMDGSMLADSLATRYMTRYLSFSNNNGYNRWLIGEPSYLGTDTLYTTTRNKLSNPSDILAQTIADVKMSNGMARIVDSLAVSSWETYNPGLYYSASSSYNQARILNGSTTSVQVTSTNVDATKVDLTDSYETNYRYLWIEPSGNYSKPELDLYLEDVLSTTYEIYCIFVPENVDKTKSTAVTKPNRVIFTLNYCDKNGTLKDQVFLDENQDAEAFRTKYKLTNTATNKNTIYAFTNDTSKVDTLYVGEFTFPVCYRGLGDGYCPNIKITSPFSAVTGTVRNDFSRDLRIAGILLKPKELVEFEEKNKK
ncbi:MAG: fasciclin domain-containing protein [Prevotella sp.]|nr:fasciclin domain-containing protein [Prevotella sp.]